jgi:hypothetical protein
VPRAGDRYPVWYDPGDHEVWAYATVKQIRELFGPGADKLTGIMSALPTTQMAPPQPAPVAQPTRSSRSASATSCASRAC